MRRPGRMAAGGAKSRQRQGMIVAVCLFGLLVTGAVLEFTRERKPAGDAINAVTTPAVAVNQAFAAPVLRDPGVPVPLQRIQSLNLGTAVTNVVSDGLSPTSGLWNVDTSTDGTTMRALFPRPGQPVTLPTAGAPDAVDAARWTRETGVCAFLIRESRDGRLMVDVRRLSSGAVAGRFETARARRPEGSERTLQVGRWSGPRADLFILDRGRPNDTMQVRVLSGESGFEDVVLSVIVQQGMGFGRRNWNVDLADVAGSGRSDIVFTTRFENTGSGRTEVHALAAQTNYSRFLLQVSTTADAESIAGRRFVTVLRRRQPSWILVNGSNGRAGVYPLAAGPATRTSPR